MDVRTREAIRYLGYGKHTADDEVLRLIAGAFEKLEQAVQRRSVCRIFDLEQADSTHIRIGPLQIESRDLGKNLKDCVMAAMFGATLGIGADRLLARSSVRDMAETVVLQACAAVLLEEYCDKVQEELRQETAGQSLFLRPRFSPGYGDFSIAYQRQIIRILDCAKTIGLTLTEGCMMVPAKSVTAVVGISREDASCPAQGCEMCTKTDCLYRRGLP